jgi:thiamine-phosphate pyrophosphorylase
MIILITAEEAFENESQIIKEMMKEHDDLYLHFRKPNFTGKETLDFLFKFEFEICKRTTTHYFQQAMAESVYVSSHHKEKDRLEKLVVQNLRSTSFHAIPQESEILLYRYFFCSPVFQSISKVEYFPTMDWDINDQTEMFKNKAVALGGVNLDNLEKLKQKGFRNIAILGAVWQSENPKEMLNKIIEKWKSIV